MYMYPFLNLSRYIISRYIHVPVQLLIIWFYLNTKLIIHNIDFFYCIRDSYRFEFSHQGSSIQDICLYISTCNLYKFDKVVKVILSFFLSNQYCYQTLVSVDNVCCVLCMFYNIVILLSTL